MLHQWLCYSWNHVSFQDRFLLHAKVVFLFVSGTFRFSTHFEALKCLDVVERAPSKAARKFCFALLKARPKFIAAFDLTEWVKATNSVCNAITGLYPPASSAVAFAVFRCFSLFLAFRRLQDEPPRSGDEWEASDTKSETARPSSEPGLSRPSAFELNGLGVLWWVLKTRQDGIKRV